VRLYSSTHIERRIGGMKKLSAVVLILLCACGGVTWAVWSGLYKPPIDEIAQMEPLFTTARVSLDGVVVATATLPAQIGEFRRGEIDRRGCVYRIDECISSTYQHAKLDDLLITVRYVPGRTLEVLEADSKALGCGPDSGMRGDLRLNAEVPHLYILCAGMIPVRFQLSSVTWVNADWLISVGGGDYVMREFIRQYPY
jgi:hypothetical protein